MYSSLFKKYFLLATSLCIATLSCNTGEVAEDSSKMAGRKAPLDMSPKDLLREVFKTQDIKLDTSKDAIIIIVKGSTSIAEQQQRMGSKWQNAESIASAAAMKYVMSGPRSRDTVGFDIDIKGTVEKYSYSVSQIEAVNRYGEITNDFLNVLFRKNVNDIKPYFSPEVLQSMTGQKFQETLQKAFFLDEKVDQVTSKGFKVVGNKYSLYFDLCYHESGCQTYGISFISSSDKIAGLNVLH